MDLEDVEEMEQMERDLEEYEAELERQMSR